MQSFRIFLSRSDITSTIKYFSRLAWRCVLPENKCGSTRIIPTSKLTRLMAIKNGSLEVLPIVIGPKIRAASAYTSQLRGLGGSTAVLGKRLTDFGDLVGNGHAGERYWSIPTHAAKELVDGAPQVVHPFVRKSPPLRFRDFRKFLKRSVGMISMNYLRPARVTVWMLVAVLDAIAILFSREGMNGLAWTNEVQPQAWLSQMPRHCLCRSRVWPRSSWWQVMEYAEQPEALIAEASRILETGGAFCGSVSFLEPVHGRTYFNLSPLILERLLRKHGFMDVEIKPGLNGFALMLWTWLCRCGIPFADRVALPLTFAGWRRWH